MLYQEGFLLWNKLWIVLKDSRNRPSFFQIISEESKENSKKFPESRGQATRKKGNKNVSERLLDVSK